MRDGCWHWHIVYVVRFFGLKVCNMNDYRITSAGDSFRIALVLPDKRESMIGGFFTVAEARTWLTSHPDVLETVRSSGSNGEDTTLTSGAHV